MAPSVTSVSWWPRASPNHPDWASPGLQTRCSVLRRNSNLAFGHPNDLLIFVTVWLDIDAAPIAVSSLHAATRGGFAMEVRANFLLIVAFPKCGAVALATSFPPTRDDGEGDTCSAMRNGRGGSNGHRNSVMRSGRQNIRGRRRCGSTGRSWPGWRRGWRLNGSTPV